MFASELHRKFAGLRFRLKTYFFVHGFSRLLIGLVVIPFILGVLDLYFHLPILIRAGMLVGYSLYLIYLASNFLLYPLKKKISDEDLALCVEHEFPVLQDRLISSIQLSKRLEKDPNYPDSKQMVESLLQETTESIKDIRFHRAITGKPAFKLALICLLVITSLATATVGYAYKRKNMFEVMVQRLLLSSKQYPQKTHIAFVQKSYSINSGGTIELHLTGSLNYLEESLMVSLKDEENQLKEIVKKPVRELEKKGNAFVYRLEKVKESFYLRFDTINIEPTLFYFSVLSEFQSKNNPENQKLSVSLNPFDRQIFCANGENLSLQFHALGDVPQNAEIVYMYEGGNRQREVLAETGPGAYQYNKFRSVQENFSFYIQGGDDFDEYPIYTVEPKTAPKINTMQIAYEYPEYTGQKNITKQGGKIIAPVGTWANLELTANIELESARISFKKANTIQPLTLKTTKASIRFQINQDDVYFIYLLGKKDSLPNTKQIKYSIQAKKDNKPNVRNLLPIGDMECSNDASIPMHFLASDDFGVYKYYLRFKTNDEKVLQTKEFKDENFFSNQDFSSPAKLGVEKIYATTTFEVSQLKYTNPKDGAFRTIKEEDSIQFWAEAVDNRLLRNEKGKVIARPQSGSSSRLMLTVVSKTQLERDLVELLIKTKQELAAIKKNQESQIKETTDLLGLVTKGEPYEYSEVQKQEDLLILQKKVTRDSKEALRDFDKVLSSVAINHLEGIDHTRIQKMEAKLQEVIAFSKEATENINKVRKEGENARKNNLGSSVKSEKEVLQSLETLLEIMGKWEDFNEVVQTTREILEQQKKVRENTKSKGTK